MRGHARSCAWLPVPPHRIWGFSGKNESRGSRLTAGKMIANNAARGLFRPVLLESE